MKNLRQVTKNILESVEEISGKSIQVMRDENLPVLATLTMARNGAEFHVLRYKPSNDPVDYFVAHQAGFVLRLFENLPSRRFDFITTDAGQKTVESLLSTVSGTTTSGTLELAPICEMITQWSLMNLRSLPIGMRIDSWIASSFPELKDLQDRGIEIQQQQNINLLSQKIEKHYIPSALMGPVAAYAMFADRLIGTEVFATPFKAAGLSRQGEELLNAWDKTPHVATADRDLVDAWASITSMNGWYEWSPYKS